MPCNHSKHCHRTHSDHSIFTSVIAIDSVGSGCQIELLNLKSVAMVTEMNHDMYKCLQTTQSLIGGNLE